MKNTKNIKIIRFFDEVYSHEFVVVFAPTHEEFCEFMYDKNLLTELNMPSVFFDCDSSDDSGTFLGRVLRSHSYKEQKDYILIYSSDENETLVHEIFHACYGVLSGHDIELSKETNEAYAYYIGYIWKMIKKRMKEN
ncbi:MAG: hypothetical protein NTZ95_03400 [Candidatus Omnitrophica bacterium]|nr:hypothetical protein [Candidatus Omnitrophota bacterium]